MSNNMSIASSLIYIQRCLTRYGIITYFTFGVIGLLLNIAFFSQPNHRRNPTACYILAMSCCALIGLNISIVPVIYGLNHPDPLTSSFVFCQLQRYLRHAFNQMMRTFLVLNCADRYIVSSDHIRIRSFSQIQVAVKMIPCVIVFWFVVAFFPTMLGSLLNNTCNANTGLFAIAVSIYFPVVFGIIPITFMTIFGVLLFNNLKKIRGRVQPMINTNSLTNQLLRKRDRDILRMILVETIGNIITTTPLTVMLIYSAITRTATKSSDQRHIESFANYFTGTFLLYVSNCLSFWIYICASRSFRLEFKKLIIKFYGFITGKCNCVK